MRKNVASQVIGAEIIAVADGTPLTTGTVTIYVTGDNGAQAAGSVGSGACAHKGRGYWSYAPAQAETNYDHIAFTFEHSGGVNVTVQVFPTFPQTGDNFARLGAPAGASVSADVAAVKTETASIQSDTNDIQARLPAALVSGRIDASVGAMAAGTLTATAIAADAITDAKVAADVTIASVTGAVGSVTGAVGSVTAAVTVGTINAAVITAASIAADAITDAKVAADVTIASVTGAVGSVTGAVGSVTGNVGGNVVGSIGSLAAQAKLDVNAEADTAIVDARLDELLVADSDIDGAAPPAVGSVMHELLSKTAGSFTYDQTTDSLEAIRDRGDVAWITGAGGDPWATALPGAYGAGTAGNILGTNLDVVVSTLATAAALVTVQADTDNIQTRLPAALVSGRMDASVGAMAAGTVTAAAIATDAIDADALADGAITSGVFAAGAINAAAIAADAITDAKVAADVTIASVTGAVGSVTGSVASVTGAVGSVTGAVGSISTGGIVAGSFAAGAIDAAAIASDALGALELAAGAASEIATAVRTELTVELARVDVAVSTRLATAGYTAPLDAAGTRTAVGLATANLDVQLGQIPSLVWSYSLLGSPSPLPGTAGAYLLSASAASDPWGTPLPGAYGAGTAGFILGTNLDATITSRLASSSNGAGLSAIPWNAAWDAEVESEATDALNVYDPPTNAEMVARTLAAASYATATGVSAVETDTQDIQARLPAALVGGRMDSSVGAIVNGVIVAATFAANALDAVWSTAARLLTAGTNIVLAKGVGVTGFNDLDAAGVRTAVGLASANLDTQIGTLATAANLATVAGFLDTEIAAILTIANRLDTALELDGAVYRFTTNALEQAPSGGGSLTAAQVWEYLLTGSPSPVAGSAGAYLVGAGAAGDPWITMLPGAYGAGTAGKIVGDNLNATVSSRSTLDAAGVRAAVGLGAANLDTQLGAIDTKTTNLPSDPADQSLLIAASNAIIAILGTPAGASLAADIASKLATAGYTAPPTTAQIADKLLGRHIAGGSDVSGSEARNVTNALRALRNRQAIAAGTGTVYEEDDTTAAWTYAATTTAGNPLSEINPT